MLTTTELANLLSLDVDALTTKDFGDTSGACEGKEILFTGYDIYTHAELLQMHEENVRTLDLAYRTEASQV
jgi:hypothetical protein